MSDDRKYKHRGYQDGGGYSNHSSGGGNGRPPGPPARPPQPFSRQTLQKQSRLEGATVTESV